MPSCTKCKAKVGFFDLTQGVCASCRAESERSRERLLNGLSDYSSPAVAQKAQVEAEIAQVILTTESAPALCILDRIEIITSECVLGMNIFQDIGSAIRDVVGGRNQAYQARLRDARKAVLADLKYQAHQLGADAVVAVDLDYSEISGGGKSMLFLVASGTAVRLDKNNAVADPKKSFAG
ncbi:MAG: DUF74-family protein [Rhodobacteraceae bacterium]|uniref:YbjQ family protein n=1 Tax=Cypionkella sp. TaxID=2811411 RepID=UPI00132C8874|nr:YbjQ family protein [Cypionkella sp.]KAF0174082.1 MAG: DUF74-family protein [Paracoccaceae bacterium]